MTGTAGASFEGGAGYIPVREEPGGVLGPGVESIRDVNQTLNSNLILLGNRDKVTIPNLMSLVGP